MPHKLFKICLFFCTITVIQSITCMLPSNIHIAACNILRTEDRTQQENNFAFLLRQWPQLISTSMHPAIEYTKGQTLAHFLANGSSFSLLHTMIDQGETGAQKISNPINIDPKFAKCLGSTAFLALCFSLKKQKEDLQTSQSFLNILNKFLIQTPQLARMARIDGMTPAMAIATSNSAITPEAFNILVAHDPNALEGITNSGMSIMQILLFQTFETPATIQALRIALQSKKHDENFIKSLPHLLQVCKRQRKHEYTSVLEHQFSIPDFSQSLTNEAQCFCCAQGCNCCTNPNSEQTNHTDYWKKHYEQHPEEENAAKWLQKYYSQHPDEIW